jgi:hypothetical protein
MVVLLERERKRSASPAWCGKWPGICKQRNEACKIRTYSTRVTYPTNKEKTMNIMTMHPPQSISIEEASVPCDDCLSLLESPYYFDTAGYTVTETPHVMVLSCRKCPTELLFTPAARLDEIKLSIAEHKRGH